MIEVDPVTGFVYSHEVVLGYLNQNELSIIKKLASHQGEVVSREELLQAGWPSRVVVANSVNMAIKNIRTILSKASKEPVVLTLPREGYRLLPGFVSIMEDSIVAADVSDSEVKMSFLKKILMYLNKFGSPWLLIVILFIILWGTAIYYMTLARTLVCVQHNGSRLCTTEASGLPQEALQLAPTEPGEYIYGVDPVTGKGVYEKKK